MGPFYDDNRVGTTPNPAVRSAFPMGLFHEDNRVGVVRERPLQH
jgi:hypothetical protein